MLAMRARVVKRAGRAGYPSLPPPTAMSGASRGYMEAMPRAGHVLAIVAAVAALIAWEHGVLTSRLHPTVRDVAAVLGLMPIALAVAFVRARRS
jgi:hypothetical protein